MDVLHDNSHRLWLGLCEDHKDSVPDYVMNYSLPNEKSASEIEVGLFADPARRLFPIDSEASTWLSMAYFGKRAKAGELPYKPAEHNFVEGTILKAAEMFGISDDVKAINTLVQSEEEVKQASANDDNYGWVMIHEKTGEVLGRKYPMFDERGVKKASAYFAENRTHYPIGIRRTISRNIMRKAAEFEVGHEELSGEVLREAGYGLPRVDCLMEELYERAHLTKDAESSALLANINVMIDGLGAEELAQNLDKVAEVISAFDTTSGLDVHYGDRLRMPSDILFDVSIKEASDAVDDAVELNRFTFSLSKLAEQPLDTYVSVLGEDFGSAITEGESSEVIDTRKLAEHLGSLSKPGKAALENHLYETLS